ncbi:hypothetical protein DIT71_03160 [Marinobacter vulgaris]|uniref:Uncharacterized protein n=1 Tax=Marinobacter vulgaris TaxID=1928331 RepID=A0A2V3ZPV6_9GAMM|nr:hypothetical protein [Marinobacter vulgaris]PXX93811.1 hypothetical protein DIT71_03160 [Marinobacter vulgaris]TSJ72169.1 hypothetical protein FPC41_00110 [Marinobacter vulgaris]
MDQPEVDWCQYQQHIETYKFYIEMAVKIIGLYFAVSGAMLSFYFANTDTEQAKLALYLPWLIGIGLSLFFTTGAVLSVVTRDDVFKLREKLGLEVAPETGVLTLLLGIFSIVLVACVIGFSYVLWSTPANQNLANEAYIPLNSGIRAMSEAIHWADYVSAIGIPVIALIGSWIAFRQFQVSRNKLKHDLFEKRLEIYEAVRNTLGIVARNGKLTQAEEINYLVATRSAKWLFGNEVYLYLDETLWDKIVDLGLHNSILEGPSSEEKKQHAAARGETMKWLISQHSEFDALCAKYLKLRH